MEFIEGTKRVSVSTTRPMPATLPYSGAVTLAGNTVYDASRFGDVRLEFSGGTALSASRSLAGTNYYPCKISDEAGNTYDSVTAAGIYYVDGGFLLKFSQAVTVAAGA